MKKNILIIIPHGGNEIPEELAPCTELDELTLFMDSDACSNLIFEFNESSGILKTEISSLYIDLSKPYQSFAQRRKPGVIRRKTRNNREVFHPNSFPDDLALANIFKRHYFPFYKTLKKILKTGEVDLVLECHTMWPIGPGDAHDAGKPRPLGILHHRIDGVSGYIDCGHQKFMEILKEELQKNFTSGKSKQKTDNFVISQQTTDSQIIREVAYTGIPIISLSISRSLFLTEEFFNAEYLMVDELRLKEINSKLWDSISKASTAL
jgi:hypothetical protein